MLSAYSTPPQVFPRQTLCLRGSRESFNSNDQIRFPNSAVAQAATMSQEPESPDPCKSIIMLFPKCSPTGKYKVQLLLSHKGITSLFNIFQGVEGIKEYGIDKILQAAASQLSDQLPESREAARTALLELQTVYEKVHPLIKLETQSSPSSSSSPAEEQISEAEPITWEIFCQSKLSALSAQAVLRVTNVVTVTAREGLVTTGPSSSSQL